METHTLKCTYAHTYEAKRAPRCGCAACNVKWLHAELSRMSARMLTLEKALRTPVGSASVAVRVRTVEHGPRKPRSGSPYDAGKRRR